MKIDTAKADHISDQVIDICNAALKDGTSTTDILAGLLLGLIGYTLTAPKPEPATLTALREAASACFQDMMEN